MCHYTYTLFTCCSEPKENDGIDVEDVEFCNNCPLSSDGFLYDDDFFHCPNVTGECLGDSDYMCRECSLSFRMEDDNDEIDRDKKPDDDFSDYSDEEARANWFPVGKSRMMICCRKRVFTRFLELCREFYALCRDWY